MNDELQLTNVFSVSPVSPDGDADKDDEEDIRHYNSEALQPVSSAYTSNAQNRTSSLMVSCDCYLIGKPTANSEGGIK